MSTPSINPGLANYLNSIELMGNLPQTPLAIQQAILRLRVDLDQARLVVTAMEEALAELVNRQSSRRPRT